MKKLLFYAILTSIVLAGCSPSTKISELRGISLNKSSLEIEMGETKQLVVIYEPEDAEEGAPEIRWESSKERVATVSKNGRVEGKQKGTAVITAFCGKLYAECKVEVVTGGSGPVDPIIPPDPDKFSVSPAEINSPAAGGTFTLNVKANIPWSAACEETWASLTPNSGDGDAEITVTVEPATSSKSTEQKITFTAGEFTDIVTITRAGKKSDKVFGFSVSNVQQIVFSSGNLQYHVKDKVWRFAGHQYDFVGKDNSNITWENYNNWIDLFGWGTGNRPTIFEDYEEYPTFYEWGKNTISNGESYTWRTMSKEEWEYIISGRANAADLQSRASVNDINGYILLPDDWVKPEELEFTAGASDFTTNSYSLVDWEEMEYAGAVFLPAAYHRDRVKIYEDCGYYWSSSPEEELYNNIYSYCFFFTANKVKVDYDSRRYGMSVRLVRAK